jgi:hypothetical protein
VYAKCTGCFSIGAIGAQLVQLLAASAAGGVLFENFVINNGLWPSVPISVGNATLVVSKHVYV